ncbi:MAG TPA: amidohydrolase family protein [Actinomycetota bacterium]|nr:amidohydrolase family protein [Actinomycetota bacterium]
MPAGSSRRELVDLPLHAYRPVPRIRLPQHPVHRARFPAIDAHNHLGRWLSEWLDRPGEWAVRSVPHLLDLMDRCNLRAIVNLDGRWGEELEANLDRYDRAHPGRFVTFCHVDWAAASERELGRAAAASLRASVAAGAKGLKVWKDLGLHVRDAGGELVLPDDRRLAPLWETAAELRVPVFIHTADPVAFFDPVDERNERLEQLLAHPEWSFADPSFPRFERLIEAFEGLVSAQPDTTFVGVHVAGYAEDLSWVGRMLGEHPNLHIDIAARVAELGRQPRAARELVLAYPDRILFGIDEFPPDPANYAIYLRFLETADEHFPHSAEEIPLMGRWAISGLGLPDEVLRKVYADNALRVVPGLDTSEGGTS